MLNRRFLRQKSLQALYAFMQTEETSLPAMEKRLRTEIHKLYDFYIYQLSFVVELVDFASEKMDENKQKHLPTEEEKNPNTRFVDSQLIRLIRTQPVFVSEVKRLKINWSKEKELLRHVFFQIQNSAAYADFLANDNPSLEDESIFWATIMKRKIATNHLFYAFFEEQSIYWGNDFNHVAFWVTKTLKAAHENPDGIVCPENQFIVPDDEEFAVKLTYLTIQHNHEYEQMIAGKLQNWELERVALLDMIIMKMAMVEILNFPSIPIKATLNEYVEMTKLFSSENSRSYVNGILHSLVQECKEQHKIKKTGRGLIE